MVLGFRGLGLSDPSRFPKGRRIRLRIAAGCPLKSTDLGFRALWSTLKNLKGSHKKTCFTGFL